MTNLLTLLETAARLFAGDEIDYKKDSININPFTLGRDCMKSTSVLSPLWPYKFNIIRCSLKLIHDLFNVVPNANGK